MRCTSASIFALTCAPVSGVSRNRPATMPSASVHIRSSRARWCRFRRASGSSTRARAAMQASRNGTSPSAAAAKQFGLRGGVLRCGIRDHPRLALRQSAGSNGGIGGGEAFELRGGPDRGAYLSGCHTETAGDGSRSVRFRPSRSGPTHVLQPYRASRRRGGGSCRARRPRGARRHRSVSHTSKSRATPSRTSRAVSSDVNMRRTVHRG